VTAAQINYAMTGKTNDDINLIRFAGGMYEPRGYTSIEFIDSENLIKLISKQTSAEEFIDYSIVRMIIFK